MKLPLLFNITCTQPNTSTSHWPLCSQQPKTLSFRWDEAFQPNNTKSSHYNEPPKCSISLIDDDLEATTESVIRGLKSDRLFFEPDETNSILAEAKEAESGYDSNVEKNVTLLSMESKDPFLDFKKSMEEMVEANNGVMDWNWLQELFGCYLNVNEKSNHGFIIGAFVELLVSLDLEVLGLLCSSSSSFVTADSSASPFTFSSSNISTACSSSNAAAAIEEGCLVDENEMMLFQA
ncbi:hypothetical protein QQ045_016052 [Rhodiola kirilowii]